LPGPIPPGGEGTIQIKLNTAKRGGKTVNKKITVFTNDPNHQRLYIDIKVKVDRLYALSHRRVNLVGNIGEALQQTVTLTPETKYAFKLTEVSTKRGEHIKYQLNEVSDEKGVRYELAIENTKKDTGPYFDTMYLKTDSKYAPEIKIQVFGNIKVPPIVEEK
jgi:hypothetical protein